MTGTQLSHERLLAFVSTSADVVKTLGFAKLLGTDITAATDYLKTNPSPQFLLVEVPSAEAAPALLDALADAVHPGCKVIVTGKIDTLSFYQWLIGLGIHEYLLAPFTPAQLTAALEKGAATTPAAAAPPVKKLIAVIGARGGVGATTVATNLAASFATDLHLSTALVDLDPHFGTVLLGLDLEPVRGLRDALEKPDRVDSLFLDRVMVKPIPNLAILSAEEALPETLATAANAGQVLFSALAEKFPVIVVDLPRQMNPLTRHVLAHADQVILVAEPQLLALRDALRLKDYLVDQLKRPAPLLLLNREGMAAKQELSLGDFTKHFGAAPVVRIPFIAEALAASARGELLSANAKTAPAMAGLRQLAQRLTGIEPVADKPRTLLGKFKPGAR